MSWSLNNVVDLSNKIAIITGANSGLGYETSLALVSKDCTVIMAVRNIEKGKLALEKIQARYPNANLRLYKLDLADLSSIKIFADNIKKDFKGIDILINNAGVMNVPYQKTVDGFELHFGGNYLGHFALTLELLSHMNSNARVVSVTSFLARMGNINFEDLNSERQYIALTAYAQSKLANLYFSLEFGKKLKEAGKNIYSLAAHPGYANTNIQSMGKNKTTWYMKLGNTLFAQPAKAGALPILRASLDNQAHNGEFYGPAIFNLWGNPILMRPFSNALNQEISIKLWEESEKMTGIKF